jgi:hypothetical protein
MPADILPYLSTHSRILTFKISSKSHGPCGTWSRCSLTKDEKYQIIIFTAFIKIYSIHYYQIPQYERSFDTKGHILYRNFMQLKKKIDF